MLGLRLRTQEHQDIDSALQGDEAELDHIRICLKKLIL